MDRINLTVSKQRTEVDAKLGYEPYEVVDIFINGRNLIEILREIEQPFADREEHPRLAGQYVGLRPEVIFLPSRHFLGDPDDRHENFICEHKDKIVIYECGQCGYAGCWPMLVTITVTEETVTWSDFEHAHRSHLDNPWRYDSLGPFVFKREQYVAQLIRETA